MRTAGWGRAHRRISADGGHSSLLVPRATSLFFVLVAIVMLTIEPYIAQVNNPNENSRAYETMALVEHKTFRLDEIVARHGHVGDLARVPESAFGPGAKHHEGKHGGDPDPKHFASLKGPATSYLGIPFYWAFTKIAPKLGHAIPNVKSALADRQWWLRVSIFVMRFFAVQIPCFFFLVWFERWLRPFTDDVVLRLTAVAAVGLGTNYLAFSLMFVSHAATAAAGFAAFGLIYAARIESNGDSRARDAATAFFAGLLLGLVPVLEYTAVPVSVVLGFYGLFTFYRPLLLLAYAIGGAIDVGLMTFYQARACGNWASPCFKYSEGYVWLHNKTFGAGKPSWSFLKEVSWSHGFGFFSLSPYMVLGLLAIPFGLFFTYGTRLERRERRIAVAVFLVAMVALWVGVSTVSNPRGGWSVGPRYLGTAPPFFGFGAVIALERIAKSSRGARLFARVIGGGLAFAGVAQVGLTSILYNTIPDSVVRPLAQFTLPLARAGFAPYDAGQLIGWSGTSFWDGVVAALFLAWLLAVAWPTGDGPWRWTFRVVGLIAIGTLALLPAFAPIKPPERDDVRVASYFVAMWEPPGRDRLHKARALADERGADQPCLWTKVADLERGLRMLPEADADERRAGSGCR